MSSIRFVFDEENLRSRIRVDLMVPGGAIRSDVQRRALLVRERAKLLLRERSAKSTGSIASTIRFTTVQAGPDEVRAQVGSDDPRATWVNNGTGVFGPRNAPIRARGQFMVFESSLSTVRKRFIRGQHRIVSRSPRGTVFARSIQGQPGKHFLEDALSAAFE